MSENDKRKRKRKRKFALVWSGIMVIVLLPTIGVLISLFIDSIIGITSFITYPINLIGSFIILPIGLFWALWSNYSIYKIGEGSPVPTKDTETQKLVIVGPYKYTRNPMIFGYALFWYALGFFFNSLFLTLGFTTVIIVFLIAFVKLWEEKNLEERFGHEYIEYKRRVSFVIPLPQKKEK